jgi:hypothetical protein
MAAAEEERGQWKREGRAEGKRGQWKKMEREGGKGKRKEI